MLFHVLGQVHYESSNLFKTQPFICFLVYYPSFYD